MVYVGRMSYYHMAFGQIFHQIIQSGFQKAHHPIEFNMIWKADVDSFSWLYSWFNLGYVLLP